MAGINNDYLKDHKLFRVHNKNIILIFPLVAVLVALIVFWCLKLIGITMTSDTLCDLEEHTHISECYSGDELVCLIPEHTHSVECFPDRTVDTETADDWTKTVENVILTNDIGKNLVSVATTQVGYEESSENYEFNAFADKNNYTRYGEWYGTPYGKWNTIFVSFCINYANINDSDALESSSAETMRQAWEKKSLYFPADKYIPTRGDVVFFNTESDSKADRTAIVIYSSDSMLVVIEGDVDGAVKRVVYENTDSVMGYGASRGLYPAQYIEEPDEETEEEYASIGAAELSGRLTRYIPNEADEPMKMRMMKSTVSVKSVYDSEPLLMMAADDHDITYTSHLEGEVINVVFKDQSGNILGDGSTVYIGETYIVSLEFSEINSGSTWVQFKHDADGCLTYHVPSYIHCKPFEDWHTISAKTESGTVKDVGEYFIDENGLLRVRFFENAEGINFVDKYSNVDFVIDFNATVGTTTESGSTLIEFNDKISVNLNIDGNAGMDVTKTHGEYDAETNTMEYTIKVEAIHGVVKDLVIDDQIWENHYTLRDTITVTDLDGNVLDPQPIVSDHPSHSTGAEEGFRISGFPDFSAGQGFLIKYKTSIYDNLLGNEEVDMWNGLDSTGKSANGNTVYVWTDDWLRVELEKMKKDGNQAVLEDADGNPVPVVEWEVEIRKSNSNLQGTVVIDTLGEGLSYYTDEPIMVKRYDEWGNRLDDIYISWNDVAVDGNSMSFSLPEGFAFEIVYYSAYEELDENETKNYTNSVKATINGKEEQVSGSADVVGFVPHVSKSARGDDGEYVYFTIEAQVPSVIKDWGGFYLTDLAAFWGYPNSVGYLYVENLPEDIVITATTESGQTVTFTPYTEGGTIENTYLLVTPAAGDLRHSFNIYFNTASPDLYSSKWILNEDATLKITYKIPFDAKTGTEWEGELTGDEVLEDVLLDGHRMANEAYFNYTPIVSGTASTTYEYSPRIIKKSEVHEDGTIDYTVVFNNTIPGTGGNEGYIDGSTDKIWFNDTFDEKLEYVPGSLVVTGYSPWQKDLWLAKFKYDGTVSGNTIEALGNDFLFLDYNEEADASGWNGISKATDFRSYYHWIDAGGRFVFTYTLKLKDEYLETTDHAMFKLDNTAELTWDNDGSSGPVTETSEYETGLIDKHVVQQDSKLLFQIHINRGALDILEGLDTLTIEDTMTNNLSVYWESIKLKYEQSPGVWIDFASDESEYPYSITYDPPTNRLTFVVPDSLHIIIDYTTLITESGQVSVSNAVKVDGKAEISDIIDAIFKVDEHGGGASGSNYKITLLKQDGITNEPLEGATFLLYGLKGDTAAVIPDGAPPTVITEKGEILNFIGSYTTGADGIANVETQYLTVGGPYAIVEQVAPEGYEILEDPVYFYFYKEDPDGKIQMVTTLLAIENLTGSFLIPETGGIGTLYTAIIGAGFIAVPVLYSLIRRKRERRFV